MLNKLNRKHLLIALSGVALLYVLYIALIFFLSNYDLSQHQHQEQADYKYNPLSFIYFLIDSIGRGWHWLRTNDRPILATFTIGIFIFTALLAGYTKELWTSTSNLVRASDRMAKKELRAYVSVIVGDATYQESGKGIVFEGRPMMINTGRTPAYKVRFKANAAILPVPLPPSFDFPLPGDQKGGATLGPGHNFTMSATVSQFVLDQDVKRIKIANGDALYVWGIVTYRDAFSRLRKTEFCQTLTWLPDNRVFGYYNERHNDAK